MLTCARAWLPTGQRLDPGDWLRRHRAIAWLLWAHVVAVPMVGVAAGHPRGHAGLEAGLLLLLALGASRRRLPPTWRAVLATLGLVSSSAILTHYADGLIEMHFHFFVVVAVVSLYQSWVPFLVALGFVVVHHGIGGQLLATEVYNHPSAVADAWRWALIHGGFILAESAACLVAWRLNEVALDGERGARRGLERANSDLAAAQAVSSIGSWDLNLGSGRLWWSDELHRIMGHRPGSFFPEVGSFAAQVVAEERDRVSTLIRLAYDGAPLDFECSVVRPDGTARIVHVLGECRSEGLEVPWRLTGTCQDVTERKALEREVEHRAYHDALTGVGNRALFLDRLEHAVAASAGPSAPLSLVYLDLDDFKGVNDTLGHGVGDELLIDVARRLQSIVRSSDTVARLGGDEFAVLLTETGLDGAVQVAQALLRAFEEPLLVGGARVLARASIGIAVADLAAEPSDLLRHADIAMYAAKRQGTHGFEVFNRAMHSSLTDRRQLEAELAEAIAQDQLVLHYQPLVDLATGSVDGVEALVRWDHPVRGVLPPSEFIGVAEETGMIGALGTWVLRRATSDVRAMQNALGCPITVSVNIAAPELHADVVGAVRTALRASGLDPRHLVLEITETCLMTQQEVVVPKLEALRRMGVRVAIDDFGTGYSSLAYLRRLPIDSLKIDRSFVRDMTEGAEQSALARSIVELGTLFGLRVVGEGVETRAQAAALTDMGCHIAQGYLYSRPVDAASLIRALRAAGDRSWTEPAGDTGDRALAGAALGA